jgi:hypothetical protein
MAGDRPDPSVGGPTRATRGPSVPKVVLIAAAVLVLVIAMAIAVTFAVAYLTRPPATITWESDEAHGAREVVAEGAGSEHCDWDDTTFLDVGRVAAYVRDETGRFSDSTPVAFDADATLPTEARFTGWRDGERELWAEPQVGEAGPTSVYIVTPSGVERWPRFDSGCA